MTKAAQPFGIITALVAAVLWLMGRWVHEVQRCLRGASAGVRSAEDCSALVGVPAPAFAMWLPLMVFSAIWAVYLLAKGHRWIGAATLIAALGVLLLAGSLM